MRTITIKSKGSIKISPDQAEVQLSLSSTKKDYAKAVSTENEKLQRLQGACQSAGIEWDQVKAASFDVSTEYHSERDKNDNYHRVFDGYCASHELVIRFPLDTALLNRALSEISMADTGTEIEVKFTFADQDGAARAVCFGAAVGGLSHVVLDMMTPQGIPLLPFTRKNRFSLHLCKTGSIGEYAFCAAMIAAMAVFLRGDISDQAEAIMRLVFRA